MPQYEISVPGQGTFAVDSPSELTDAQVWQAVQSQVASAPMQEAPPVDQNQGGIADVFTSFQQGAVGATKALTDVAGADNAASEYLGETSEGLQKELSPARQQELQRQAKRMTAAEESARGTKSRSDERRRGASSNCCAGSWLVCPLRPCDTGRSRLSPVGAGRQGGLCTYFTGSTYYGGYEHRARCRCSKGVYIRRRV